MTDLKVVKNREDRNRVLRTGTVQAGDLQRKIVVTDVSHTGAKIRCDLDLEPQEMIYLRVAGFPAIAATVRWVKGDRMGVEVRSADRDRRQGPREGCGTRRGRQGIVPFL